MKHRIIKILITGGIITLVICPAKFFFIVKLQKRGNSKSAFNYDMHIWIYEGL